MGARNPASILRRLLKLKQDGAATSTMTGTPAPAEGSNGDIQIRMTDRGPKLFAKLGNKWRETDLKDVGTAGPEVKMHVVKGVMIAGSTSNRIPLPSWIIPASVVGISFFSNHSSSFWHVSNWADISDDDGSSAETGPYVTRFRVLYDRSRHNLYIDRMGTQADDGKGYKIIVFYT